MRWQDDGGPMAGRGTRVRRFLLAQSNLLLGGLTLLAAASLVAEYGFFLSDGWLAATRLANVVVLYGFLLYVLLKIVLVSGRVMYVRRHRLEIFLGAVILLHLLFPGTVATISQNFFPAVAPEIVTRVYLVLTQLFVVAALIPAASRYSNRLMTTAIHPSALIAASFLLLILTGTLLLLLPKATNGSPLAFIDALFTASSAVCVTGLTVVDTVGTFSQTGHVILLLLIQIGGLGIMTLTTFFAFFAGDHASLKQYSTLQSLVGEESFGKIRRTVVMIGVMTFTIELAGAGALWVSLGSHQFSGAPDRLFFSVFHAVSAFCNAGFALTSDNLAVDSLHQNTGVLVSIMGLIVLGGLGFPVILSLIRLLRLPWQRKRRQRFPLHARLVLFATGFLIVAGTAGLFFLEQNHSMAGMPAGERLLASAFHSVSSRTAGFNTIPLGEFGLPALLLLMGLMWIGASPGSTGGGVKTTSFVVAVLAVRAFVSGRDNIEVHRHRIPASALLQAFCTLTLSFLVIGCSCFVLLLTENAPFHALLFEVVSALGTVGLSMGVTPHLTTAGKLVIIATIFTGRIGVLALVLAFTRRRLHGRFEFTEEKVYIT